MPLSTAPKRLDTNSVSCHVWDMQVIGLCRFSYLGHGGFQVVEENMDVRAAYLYAPERMEERLRTFETMTLPSVRAQTDPDFTFLIVVGERMPEPWIGRLRDLTRDVPQIVIKAYPPRRHRRIMQKAINEFRDFGNEPCLQFRLDDDDAVGVDFVERTRETARDLAAFSRTHGNIAIDFNRGFSAHPGPEGLAVSEQHSRYLGCGLSVMIRPEDDRCLMNFGHHKIDQMMTTVTFSDEDMFVRGLNEYNDSRQKPWVKTPDMKLLDEDTAYYFKARFGIDNDAIRRAWSGT